MDVYLNNEAVTDPLDPAATVKDLIAAVREANPTLIVTCLKCDGREAQGPALDELLQTSVAAPGRLDVELDHPHALAARSLGQVAELLEQSRQRHVSVAEAVAAGRNARALELLTDTFGVWNTAEQSLNKINQVAHVDWDAVTPGNRKPSELIGSLRDHLQAVKQALEIRDYVAVADLVEYEMPKLTDGWQEMLVGMQQHLLAGQ